MSTRNITFIIALTVLFIIYLAVAMTSQGQVSRITDPTYHPARVDVINGNVFGQAGNVMFNVQTKNMTAVIDYNVDGKNDTLVSDLSFPIQTTVFQRTDRFGSRVYARLENYDKAHIKWTMMAINGDCYPSKSDNTKYPCFAIDSGVLP